MANRLDEMIDDLTKLKDRKVNKSNVGDFVWAIEDVTRRYFPERDPLRQAVHLFGGAFSVDEPKETGYYDSLSCCYDGKAKALAKDVQVAKAIIRKEIRRLKHLRRMPR